MEIIVIDNHSQDDSIGTLRNRLSACENVHIVETPHNIGFGAGYNYGARYARGRYLLINNPEKILQEQGVEAMVHVMDADPSIGILAPRILHADGTRRLSIRAFPDPFDVIVKRTLLKKIFKKRMRRYLQLDANLQARQNVDWVIGGCFMIHREFYEHLHGFDERFFLFFEDIDLCRRVHIKGKDILYDPNVTATDKKKRLSGDRFWGLFLSRAGRIHLVSAGKYFWKWGTTP